MKIDRLKTLAGHIGLFADKILDEAYNTKSSRFFYYYILWLIMIMFITFSYLAGSTPLAVLNPFSSFSYHIPVDKSSVTVFVADEKGILYPVTRKIYLGDMGFRQRAVMLIGETGKLPYYETAENAEEFHNELLKLPRLDQAIVSVWRSGDRIIIDFSEKAIVSAISQIKIRRDSDQNKGYVKKRKMELLDLTFQVIEKTMFVNNPDVKNLEFRLNGRVAGIEGLAYDLSAGRTP